MSVDKPWIVFVAGVLTLLAVGLAIRHGVGQSRSQTGDIANEVVARADQRGGAQSGWAARENPPGAGAGPVARDSRPGHGSGQRAVRDDTRSAPGARALSGQAARPPARGDDGPGSTIRTATGLSADAAANESVPFRGARTADEVRRRSRETVETVSGSGSAQGEHAGDNEDLVVSLPLKDGSLEAEKGESPVVAEGIAYDGGAFRFSPDSQLILPNAGNINAEAGSIAFWIQPDWHGSDDSSAALVDVRAQHVFENRIQIDKNGQYLRFIFADDTGTESGAGIEIGHWQPGEWHSVVATYGNGMTSFYVDGRLVGQRPYSGQFNVLPGTQFRVGSNYPGDGPGATGAMSDFRVYRRPLTPEEVSDFAARQP